MTIQYGTDQTLHEEVLKQINSKPEPENLTHADTVALKDLDDAFTQAQVDNLVKELEEWALRAQSIQQLFILDSLTWNFAVSFRKMVFSNFCWKNNNFYHFEHYLGLNTKNEAWWDVENQILEISIFLNGTQNSP